MRIMLLIVLLILMPQMLLAYELGMLNLKGPADLESRQGEIRIQHRFSGDVTDDPLDNLFGADLGANVNIGLRYAVSGLELSASRSLLRREYIVAVGYGCALPGVPLRCQTDVHFFRYEEFDLGVGGIDKKSGVFGLLSLQTEPLHNKLTLAVNLGYDGREEEFGAGFGFAITILERTGTIQKVSAIGEYFPTTNEDENDQSFAFGLRLQTYGHDFDIVLGNNSNIGARRLMAGAADRAHVRLGFNIKRRI